MTAAPPTKCQPGSAAACAMSPDSVLQEASELHRYLMREMKPYSAVVVKDCIEVIEAQKAEIAALREKLETLTRDDIEEPRPDDARGELLSCPFCREAVMFRKALWPSDGNVDSIIHAAPTECGMIEFSDGTVDESILAKWNTRAAPARCDAVNANALQNAFDLGFRAAGGSCHLPPSAEAFFQSWLRDGSSHARREREEEIPPAALVSPSEAGREMLEAFQRIQGYSNNPGLVYTICSKMIDRLSPDHGTVAVASADSQPPNSICKYCDRRVFEPCRSIMQAMNACTLSSTPRAAPQEGK